MICLGLEATAHTFGIGIAKDKKILANARDVYVPEKGGIHPMEAKEHHEKCKEAVLKKALEEAGIRMDDVDVIAYSAGPGLAPCLMIGTRFAKELSLKIKKPLVGVNHCIAHIEIGKLMTDAKDPVTLYVSGGNTQVIAFTEGRYRIFGETLDKPIGSAIDTFIRETGGKHPGGPVMQELAKNGNYIELPYVVKGMDLSFSGILTEAVNKFRAGARIEDLCYSFQETCYAMLTEVTERAVAHTGKNEILLTGGVAASQRLQEMLKIMCKERKHLTSFARQLVSASVGCTFHVCPREYAGDCGANIAWLGILAYKSGYKSMDDFNPRWRTDEVDVTWL